MSERPQPGSGAIDPREGLFEHSDFAGLRNNVGAEGFDLGDLVSALNCDIDDELEIHRRKGFSTLLTAAIDRCMWSNGDVCLGIGSNALKIVNSDFSINTVRTGLTPAAPMAYVSFFRRVFYSNGVENGIVSQGVNRTWGIAVPPAPVISTATPGGNLLPGRYQVSMTYLRNDGQESGASRATVTELASTNGISLTLPVSTDPTVNRKAVYATSVNGETLYRCGIVDNATTVFAIRDLQMDSVPLETQFLGPPPGGNFLGYLNGRMLVAADNRLYPSEPYNPELFDLRKAIPFPARITMIAPLNNKSDGVWIGTDKQVIWLNGSDPESWEYKVAADYGVIPGTLYYSDGEAFGDAAMAGDQLAFFATERGLCVTNVAGYFRNLTQERFAYPTQPYGAGVVRRHRGTIQYVVTLQGDEVAGNTFS